MVCTFVDVINFTIHDFKINKMKNFLNYKIFFHYLAMEVILNCSIFIFVHIFLSKSSEKGQGKQKKIILNFNNITNSINCSHSYNIQSSLYIIPYVYRCKQTQFFFLLNCQNSHVFLHVSVVLRNDYRSRH